MSERILQRTAATITSPVLTSLGDTPSPLPDTATVTITRADGTLVVDAVPASPIGNGVFTYSLTPTDTAVLDRLTVEWSNLAVGTTVETVDVVGGFLFTVPQARAMRPLEDTTDYPTADIVAMRNTVEDTIEGYCGAFVPRYTTETVSGSLGRPLQLSKPFVRAIRSVTVDGTALSVDELDLIGFSAGSFLYGGTWTSGYSNVTVGYEHGRDQAPERIKRAALLLAKVWLVSGPVDDRTNTFTSTEGGTFSLVTPGRGGSYVGVPEVDAAIGQNLLPVMA